MGAQCLVTFSYLILTGDSECSAAIPFRALEGLRRAETTLLLSRSGSSSGRIAKKRLTPQRRALPRTLETTQGPRGLLLSGGPGRTETRPGLHLDYNGASGRGMVQPGSTAELPRGQWLGEARAQWGVFGAAQRHAALFQGPCRRHFDSKAPFPEEFQTTVLPFFPWAAFRAGRPRTLPWPAWPKRERVTAVRIGRQ